MSTYSLPLRTVLLAQRFVRSRPLYAATRACICRRRRAPGHSGIAPANKTNNRPEPARRACSLPINWKPCKANSPACAATSKRCAGKLDINKRASQDQSGAKRPQSRRLEEQSAFDGPMGLFRSGKYKEAARRFGQFLGRPTLNSPISSRSQVLSGQQSICQQKFQRIQYKFCKGWCKTKSATHAPPDALLVIAASQIEQK